MNGASGLGWCYLVRRELNLGAVSGFVAIEENNQMSHKHPPHKRRPEHLEGRSWVVDLELYVKSERVECPTIVES